jgi:hypothetical protein
MLSLFITYSSLGQIKGKIVDDKQQAASFANILVLNTKDSSLVKGEAADVDGKFEISGLKPQAYLLQVSAVGFQKSYQVINLESAKDWIWYHPTQSRNTNFGRSASNCSKTTD